MRTTTTRKEFLEELTEFLPQKSTAAELGVLTGDFSALILQEISIETLYLIDPYTTGGKQYGSGLNNLTTAYSGMDDYHEVLQRFKNELAIGRVFVDKRFSFEAVPSYANAMFDFVYIDASHLYEDVKKDLLDWLPKLKKTGLLCGHDYVRIDHFRVIQAVNEFCEQQGFELILLNTNGGDYALRRKP